MIFEFKYCKFDVDVEATRELRIPFPGMEDENDDYSFLSQNQIAFFDSLGVDMKKTKIKRLEFLDEENLAGSVVSYVVRFLLKGKFLAIPRSTEEFFSDEELFGNKVLEQVDVIENGDEIPVQTIEDMLVKFNHPCLEFEEFDTWDCGYILGMAIVKTSA